MLKWRRESVYDKNQNRYIDSIMQGDLRIWDCGSLSDLFINQIIYAHNVSIEETYQRGLTEGAEIAKNVYKGKGQ